MCWNPQQLLGAAVKVKTGGEFKLLLVIHLPLAFLLNYKMVLKTTNLFSTFQSLFTNKGSGKLKINNSNKKILQLKNILIFLIFVPP